MGEAAPAADFGRIAVALGFLTHEQLAEALTLKEKEVAAGKPARLGEVCLKFKILSREEVLLILRAQGKRILCCKTCKKTFNVPGFRHDREYPCKSCGKPMTLPSGPVEATVAGDLRNSDSRIIRLHGPEKALRHLIPGYEIIEMIGRGGMGSVYRAKDSVEGKTVAVKLLSPILAVNSDFVRRFFMEAKVARRLHHPNIIRAYEAGEAGDFKYLLMEYIKGRTLEEMLADAPMVSEKAALSIVRQVAQGLDYAWAHRIIHRDIKPANLLVAPRKRIKICDMGLSKDMANDISLTMTGQITCTPQYAAPEQGRGDSDLDCRTDTYSLGVTLFQLLTGRLPFPGKTPGALIIQHATQPPPDPKRINGTISAPTAALTLRMLRKMMNHRPTPADVIRETQDILKTLPPRN